MNIDVVAAKKELLTFFQQGVSMYLPYFNKEICSLFISGASALLSV